MQITGPALTLGILGAVTAAAYVKRGAFNDDVEGQIEPQGGFGLVPASQRALPQLRRRAELQLPDERLADILFDRDGDVLGGMTFERAVKQDPRRVDAKISQRIGEAFEQVFGPHQGDPFMKGLYLQGLQFARQTHEGRVPVKAMVSLVEENLNRALYNTFPRMPHDARIILRRSQPIFDAAFADAARMAAQASRAAAGTEDGPEWRALAEILAEHPQHMRRALAEALPGPVGPRDRMLGGPGQLRGLPGPRRGGQNRGSRASMTPAEAWDTYVGDQSVSEFVAHKGSTEDYVHGSDLTSDLGPRERHEVADLLEAYIQQRGRGSAAKVRAISTIAAEISRDWKKPYFGAVPYLEAMHTLHSVQDDYGYDSGREIVLRFLSNANTWKGETAKRVKLELKEALNAKGSRCTCSTSMGSLNRACPTHGSRNVRPLSTIAAEISRDWKKPYFGAVPYLEAMHTLHSVQDDYGYDSGREIVLRFLSNANTWKGETAKRVKLELKEALKGR